MSSPYIEMRKAFALGPRALEAYFDELSDALEEDEYDDEDEDEDEDEKEDEDEIEPFDWEDSDREDMTGDEEGYY
jgi:hypothetical protein